MKNKSDNPLDKFLRFFQISRNGMKIFNTISKKQMTIKEIKNSTKLSERTVRSCLSELLKKQFIKKEVLVEEHLKYMYKPHSTDSIVDNIRNTLQAIEKRRKNINKKITGVKI